ncbi:arginyl-tRNA synthetase [Kibdelosporangium banguiense]|uniref:arginine--tRNA ligase n=1 Tax=Kibdelosporangium banguiense TaxID=1365924 RepID=A0ABS4TFH4_9PSEU|nr:DALR anticodon-binding domain-containing protein [Kibdelosporangium banguiense]MBP2323167.1 arginyl-tRNA synthetase [Kibdelosporangium banguiense]
MNPAVLAGKVRAAAVEVLADRGLDSTVLPETVFVERPRNPSHGDYATNLALQVSTQIGVPSRDLAGWLAQALTSTGDIAEAQVAGPGFLNLRLAPAALGSIVVAVESAGAGYGRHPAIRALIGGDTDAERFAQVRRPPVDPQLLDRRVRENPLFLVQYAHARICRVVENSTKFGMQPAGADLGLLAHEYEGAAIRTLGEFPEVVATAAELREPHRVGRYLQELAAGLHRWYDTPGCTTLPQGDDEVVPVYLARLRLALAVRQVLVNGLEMLGVSAPERM